MLSISEALALSGLLAPALYLFSLISSADVRSSLLAAAASSVVAFALTLWLVPLFAAYLARRGLKGRDMGRRGTPKEAEEM